MGKVSHREVYHENNGFIFLADKAAQNPQGCTVGQQTRDEYDDVGGCIERVMKCHIGDTAVILSVAGVIVSHLEYFSKGSHEVIIPAQNRKNSIMVNHFS